MKKKYIKAIALTLALGLMVAHVVTFFVHEAPVIPQRHEFVSHR